MMQKMTPKESSPSNPSYPRRANFSYSCLQTLRTVYMRNKKLAQLEGWLGKPGHPFVMVGSPS